MTSLFGHRSDVPPGTHIEPEHDGPPPHLSDTHPQYPDGFPARVDDALLGHWPTPHGPVIVEHHPHGYEVHVYPCYDFDSCDACAPDRGTSNPHVPEDGHDFRACENRGGPILTVAGDRPEVVLAYLAHYGSAPHIVQLREYEQAQVAVEEEARRIEREETMRQEQQEAKEIGVVPDIEERVAALVSEIEAMRAEIAKLKRG